jgi:hypothetical protein
VESLVQSSPIRDKMPPNKRVEPAAADAAAQSARLNRRGSRAGRSLGGPCSSSMNVHWQPPA